MKFAVCGLSRRHQVIAVMPSVVGAVRTSVEKYRCHNIDKNGGKSIVDAAIDTFTRKYRQYRYRYFKGIVDSIDIDNRY